MACLLAVSSELATPPHPPPIFVQLLCYSYHPLIWLAPYCYGTPPPATLLHGRTPRLLSVVVLHCLSGRCQCLGSDCNVLPCALGLACFGSPYFFVVSVFLVVLSLDLDRVSFVHLGYWVAVFLLHTAFLFSYFTFFRLVREIVGFLPGEMCGWSHTRGTCSDCFFRGLVRGGHRGFFFPQLALH